MLHALTPPPDHGGCQIGGDHQAGLHTSEDGLREEGGATADLENAWRWGEGQEGDALRQAVQRPPPG